MIDKNLKKKVNKYADKATYEAEFDFHNRGILLEKGIKQLALSFVLESRNNGFKKILIITGKGLHSRDGVAVIKPILKKYLLELDEVSRVSDARIDFGGEGALEVVLN